MVRLKNVADSPRGIYALSGLEMFSPGEERDVDLSPGERASLGSYFRVVTAEAAQEAPAKAPEPDKHAENNIDHLRAIAEEAGVKVDRRWSESRLRAEIEKAKS
jgi:hypothetical protein